MLGWFREQPTKARLLADRIIEGMREIGVLFLAFAPLDAALSPGARRDSTRAFLLFVVLGAFLFGGALLFEWKRDHDG